MLKSQIKFRIKFFKKSLNLYLWTRRRKLHELAQIFLTKFKMFFIQTSKQLVTSDFLQKNHSKCSSAQIGCTFVNQAESLSNVWKFYRKFWKPFRWKKNLSWEKASWKIPHNAVFTITSKPFWESLKSSPTNSDTSIANTQPCRHFFC